MFYVTRRYCYVYIYGPYACLLPWFLPNASSQFISDFNTFALLCVVFISLMQTTISQARPEDEELSQEHKACLLECLRCVELWGSNYDGHACADTCFLSDGRSIDSECKLGVDMGKRYAKWKATERCRKQCMSCALSSVNYNERACVIACERSSGSDTDPKCSRQKQMFLQKH